MSTTHFVMMGKGGVGKSTIAVLLAQFLKNANSDLRCADLDPTNATFNSFARLDAQHLNIADTEHNIDPDQFDRLVEMILTSEADWVIDTGAATFLPFMNYTVQNQVFDFIQSHGRKVMIHVPIVGGPAMEETIRGLQAIVELCWAHIVNWENEFFGPVLVQGKRIAQTKAFAQFEKRVAGVVNIKKGDPKQDEKDLLAMLSRRLTFSEALEDPGFMLMQRQRLTLLQRDIDNEIAKISF